MEPVEIRCLVWGIFSAASLETDQAERDIRCVRAIMDHPIASMINGTTDAGILIEELITICYEGSIERLLSAAKNVFPQEGPYFQYQRQKHEQFYEVSLRRLQKIASPKFDDLKTACTVFQKISEDKRGSARSLVRRFTQEIGSCGLIDQFMERDATPETRDVIASALIEASGASEIWMCVRAAFREEGYKGFSGWCEAERIKPTINTLMLMPDPTPAIVLEVKRLITNLDLNYVDPDGGRKWVLLDTYRAKWCLEHLATA
ncbi:MAG: hypothetical protein WCG48_02390 [Candidatus Berkelbacteria bacterium]